MGFFDAGIFGIKGIFHMSTPAMARIMPTMGSKGIKGQRIINIKQAIPPTIMMSAPAKRRINLDMKPMKRDISRSMNMWNLTSNEAVPEADSAEIWR